MEMGDTVQVIQSLLVVKDHLAQLFPVKAPIRSGHIPKSLPLFILHRLIVLQQIMVYNIRIQYTASKLFQLIQGRCLPCSCGACDSDHRHFAHLLFFRLF